MSQTAKQLSLDVGGTDFERFHAENPRVYELFKRFTFQAIRRGFQHYSADGIGHQIRWHTGVITKGEEWKVNNNYISAYARMFEREHTEYQGFFRKRISKYD